MVKKILIFGNLGYVGQALVNYLKKKYEVYGYDNNYFTNTIYKKTKIKKQFFGDVRNIKEFNLKKFYSVIYLSAVSNDPIGNKFKNPTYQINTFSVEKIAKKAKLAGVKKFIFASSCSVYGKSHKKIQNEQVKCFPLTNYAKSKYKSEKLLKKLSSDSFRVFCLRFATACGYSNNFRNDLVLNEFILGAINSKKIVLKSDGQSYRPFVHIKDMSKSIEWSLKNDNYIYLVINIGSKKLNLKIIDCAKKIKKKIIGTKIFLDKKNLKDRRSYIVDFSLCKKLMGNSFFKYNTLEKVINDFKLNYKKINYKKISNYNRLQRLEKLIIRKKINKNLWWI